MTASARARTNKCLPGDLCVGVARSAASRTTGRGIEITDAAGTGLIWALSSVIVGRLAGLRLKHRCTMSTNAGGRVAGKEAVSDRSSGHAGGHCVRASTMVMPSPQISPAAEYPPLFASGGSYKEVWAILVVQSPARRLVSLASFS